MTTWFRIVSWHARKPSRLIEPLSLCGKRGKVDAENVDDLPASKSCEMCLRILARQNDQS